LLREQKVEANDLILLMNTFDLESKVVGPSESKKRGKKNEQAAGT
jgi:hypothetical protein